MARRDPETNPAAFLGGELRRARVAAGFSSQDALAAKLGFDRTVVAKAETGERPPTDDVLAAWCVACRLDEAVLHRLIGSPQVMHDALVHIADLSQRPYAVVQVVPASNGANAGLAGAFDIAAADGMPETLRMEGVEDQTMEKRSLVRKAAVAFDRVRGDALPRDTSRDLILKVADERWKP